MGAEFCRFIDSVPRWHPAEPLPLAPLPTALVARHNRFIPHFLNLQPLNHCRIYQYQIHQLYRATASCSILPRVQFRQNAPDLLLRVTQTPVTLWLGRSPSTHPNVLLACAVAQPTKGFQLGTNTTASAAPSGTGKNMGGFEVYRKAFFFSSFQLQANMKKNNLNAMKKFPRTNLSPTYK